MIDNNIIQSIGAGSGIDSRNLVDQLVEIEKAAPQERITEKKERYESQISDFGSLKSAIATLQASVDALTEEEGLYSKSASFTDSDALVPTELATDAQTGSYAFVVSALAQSQSLSSAEFDSQTDAVGEGTLTLSFGDWTTTSDFTQDTEQDTVVITIDSSNNSLEGLRDEINDADAGVQASIVNSGTGYVLSLTAESGESNEISMTVVEDVADGDQEAGLSRFDFQSGADATLRQMTQNQEGQDAAFTVNGLPVTRTTNNVDDVVEGLTFDLLKVPDPVETITVTVSDDKEFAKQTTRDFVDAYNAFMEEIEPLFGVDEETEERGSLYSDSLAKSVLSQFRTQIAASVTGLEDSDFTSLTNIGIRTELDGTLEIDEDDFDDAFEDRFEDVQKLLAPHNSVDGAGITVNSWGTQTNAGNYVVDLSATPAKASLELDDSVIEETVRDSLNGAGYDTSGKDYTMTISVNGHDSETLTIPADVTYESGDALANAIQSAINADETLTSNNASVTVSYENDGTDYYFKFTSAKYGTASSVVINTMSDDLRDDFGVQSGFGTTTAGIDAAGTIDGETAFGLGNVLRPAVGSDAEGLNLIIEENASTTDDITVSFSRGFSGELETLMDQFLQTNGLFDTRTASLTSNLEILEDDQESLDRRMTSYQERLMQQFIAMENILNGLSSSGGFLENLIDTLPFTASK